MHAYFITRGINQSIEVWKTFMQSQMFNWKRNQLLKDASGAFIKNPDGTYKLGADELTKVQGALRPIQFWEYAFPQESLQEVLAMMNLHKNYGKFRPEWNKYAWLMRKILKIKPIPEMPELRTKESWQITQKYVPMEAVAAYCIGIKEDPVGEHEGYGYHQEML